MRSPGKSAGDARLERKLGHYRRNWTILIAPFLTDVVSLEENARRSSLIATERARRQPRLASECRRKVARAAEPDALRNFAD